MKRQHKKKRKTASKRDQAYMRVAHQANAMHGLDRFVERHDELARDRSAINARILVLEEQHDQWERTLKAMRTCRDRLDAELVTLKYKIAETREAIDA